MLIYVNKITVQQTMNSDHLQCVCSLTQILCPNLHYSQINQGCQRSIIGYSFVAVFNYSNKKFVMHC